jgi:hypothetical protein
VCYLGTAVTPWFVPALLLVFCAHLAGGGNWLQPVDLFSGREAGSRASSGSSHGITSALYR